MTWRWRRRKEEIVKSLYKVRGTLMGDSCNPLWDLREFLLCLL